MSEWLLIPYVLNTRLGGDEIEALVTYCVDEIGCTRSPPEIDEPQDFTYSTGSPDGWPKRGATLKEARSALVREERGSIRMWYDELHFGLQINLHSHNTPDLPSVSLSIDEWYTKPWRNDNPSLIYELVLKLYDFLKPIYVYGDTYLDDSSLSREGITNGQLEDLFWVNGFGPKMTQEIGREWLLNAPARRIDECDDGGAFLWVSPLPLTQDVGSRLEELRTYFSLK